MAVAHSADGSASQNNTGTVTSFTWTGMTVNSGDTNLAVYLAFGANVSAVSAHWDSTGTNQAMTQIVTAAATTNDAYAFLFGLQSPTSGHHTLSVSWTTASDYCVDASSFTGGGAFQNTVSNTGNTSTLGGGAVTVNSPTGDMAVACFAGGVPTWTTANTGTLVFADNNAVSTGGMYRAGAGASTTVQINKSGTDGTYVAVGCDIAAAAAAGNVPYDPWPQWAPVLAQ